jgi:hypothetical protein
MSRLAIAFVSILLLSGFAKKPEPLVVLKMEISSRLDTLFTVRNGRLEVVGRTDCDGGSKNARLEREVLAKGRTHWAYSGGRRLGAVWITDYPGGSTIEKYPERGRKWSAPVLIANRPDLGHDRDGRMELLSGEAERVKQLAATLLREKGYDVQLDGSHPGVDQLVLQKKLISSRWPIVIASIGGWDRIKQKSVWLFMIAEANETEMKLQYFEIAEHQAPVSPEYLPNIDQLDIDRDGTDELILWNNKVMRQKGETWKTIFENPGYVCS